MTFQNSQLLVERKQSSSERFSAIIALSVGAAFCGCCTLFVARFCKELGRARLYALKAAYEAV